MPRRRPEKTSDPSCDALRGVKVTSRATITWFRRQAACRAPNSIEGKGKLGTFPSRCRRPDGPLNQNASGAQHCKEVTAMQETTERDGFRLTNRPFQVPLDTSRLDPSTKRRVTICNLFVNHAQSMKDIARILDEHYGVVVQTLIEHGLVLERRKNRSKEVPVDRRKSYFRSL
ncbi:MAG: hypothetical protein AB1898_23785 [Acidobacteriota bacterium]